MAAPSISEPTFGAEVPTTFSVYGCYSYDSKVRPDDPVEDEELLAASPPAQAIVLPAARRIDVLLYKGTALLYTHADVPRGECNSTRWRTRFGGPAEPLVVPTLEGEYYKVEVKKCDLAGNPEVAELSPFCVASNAPEQASPLFCFCLSNTGGEDRVRERLGAFAPAAGCPPAPPTRYPTRYDGFPHYRIEMKHAVCMVYDPRPQGKGVASISPAEFSMGHCAALVPIPADAGPVAYVYKFLLLDETKTLVLHNSPQRALQ